MGFVLTEEELSDLQARIHPSIYAYDSLGVNFSTDPQFARSVVPPCMEPDPNGGAYASVSWWTSETMPFPPFHCATVDLVVTCDGKPGRYNLAMYLSGDQAITYGREMWGEAKKAAEFRLDASEDWRTGTVTRGGVQLISIAAEFETDSGPTTTVADAFEIKSSVAADGRGIQFEPVLLTIHSESVLTRALVGRGTLTLGGTADDPLDTVPVRKIGTATFVSASTSSWTVTGQRQLHGKDIYAPYILGRNYDFRAYRDVPLATASGTTRGRS